jgi:hypothetical protein
MYRFIRLWRRVLNLPWVVRYGVRNLIVWFPVIWSDRTWDSCYIFRVLAFKLRDMGEAIGERDIHVGAKRSARHMLVAAEIARRLGGGDVPLEVDGGEYSDWAHHAELFALRQRRRFSIESDHVELLTRLLRKRILEWWD